MRNRWITSVVLAIMVLLWGAGPVLAQSGTSNTIINQDYVLAEGQTLDQDLLLVGGSLHLERGSQVRGNVVVAGGVVHIDGTVNGDVVVLGGGTELGPEALISGDLVVFGQLRRSPQSQVLGNTVEGLAASQGVKQLPHLWESLPGLRGPGEGADRPWRNGERTQLFGSLGGTLLMLVLAMLAVALLPTHVERVARTLQRSALLSIGVGMLTWVLGLMLMLLLTVICIGLPVAIVLLAALALAQTLGWIAAGRVVGRQLLAWLKVKGTLMGETAAGTLALGLVSSIPCVGWLFAIVAASWGLGAVVLTRYGVTEYPPIAPNGTGLPAVPGPTPDASHETKPLDPTTVEQLDTD